jgi:Type I phosphodiesterase / nucleotide pyrophosphatase
VTNATPVRPDYGGASVESVVPALTGRTDRAWLPEPARDATTVVLLVLDGLGWELLGAHRDALPELAGLTGSSITTIAPSTTASALTSITTGLSPIQHGVLGFRMRVDGAVLNVLRWTVDQGRPPDPFRVQRHAPFLGRSVPVVTRSEFRTSGFTASHLRDVPFHGWSTTSVLVEHCRVLAESGNPVVYAYYPGVDTVAHEFGLHDEYLARELAFADELVGRLRDALPPEAALLVTADHGEVQVGDDWHDLTPLGDLVRGCSGEGRFRWLTGARGGTDELAAAARDEFGHLAWVMTREELVDGGWLGPGPVPPLHLRRLGDVALLPHAPVGFVDPAMPGERRLVGAHGSLTAAEMLVPLLAGRGRRG